MEESLCSDKKSWSTILVCFISSAIFFSISRGYPAQDVAHIAFNVLGLLVFCVGMAIFTKGIGSKEEPGVPISASLWLSLGDAEKIKADDNEGRAKLQDALDDIREDITLLKDPLPVEVKDRVRELEKKQWGIK